MNPLDNSATSNTRVGTTPRAKPLQYNLIEEAWRARAAKWGATKSAFTAPPPAWAQLPPASNAAWHNKPAFDVTMYGKLYWRCTTFVFYSNDDYYLFEEPTWTDYYDDTAILRERSAQAAVTMNQAVTFFDTRSAATISANSTQAASVIILDNDKVLFRLSIDLDQGTLLLLFDEMELKPNYKPPFDFPAVLPNPGYTYSAEVINQQLAKLIQAAGAAYCSAPAAPDVAAYHAAQARTPLTQPPKLPMFLEPTTFVVAPASATNWNRIRKVLEDCCSWLHADHEWEPSTFAYHCISYARQAEVPFCINLYLDLNSATQRTVIEFQRMGGDGWAFLDVARAARYYLQNTDLVEGGEAVADGARKTLTEFKPPVSSEAPGRDFAAVKDAVNNILNMCMASYSDVQSEAAIALADLAAQQDVQTALFEHPTAVPQIIRMLNPECTPMTATYRCAAATLNHMMAPGVPHAQGLETAKRVLVKQALPMVAQIVVGCQIAQVLRECAALVGHVAYYLPDDIKADLKAMNDDGHLNPLLEHPDETIQSHMLIVRQLVMRA
jgi:hypothetical protein